eukprot:CAMPEP_0195122552 /NCGR_PEP_ID=MMETSP0448-20130528/126667_1 /TAXON_ID=66468 /ORGANISM="Heterocapsa triquestra, Strain CCMP 448" /LENGTH=71 /DNA_ID=CAMNT_0040160043 /DNA_START=42 /DNA_END=253 /DNA_ORIENTATION=+
MGSLQHEEHLLTSSRDTRGEMLAAESLECATDLRPSLRGEHQCSDHGPEEEVEDQNVEDGHPRYQQTCVSL